MAARGGRKVNLPEHEFGLIGLLTSSYL